MDTPDATPPNPPQQQLPVDPGPDPDRTDIAQNKDIAAFGYLWIMSVVVYFLRRHSPFVRYHAKQAMILMLLSIIVYFVPYIGRLLELALLCLMAYGFINAAQGLRKDIPIVGPLSRGEITVRDAWKQIIDGILRLLSMLQSLLKYRPGAKSPTPPPPSSTPSPAPPPSSPL